MPGRSVRLVASLVCPACLSTISIAASSNSGGASDRHLIQIQAQNMAQILAQIHAQIMAGILTGLHNRVSVLSQNICYL